MKRVLLVDAVEVPAERPVADWFGIHLQRERDLEVLTLPASSPRLIAAAEAADGIIISGSPRDAWADSPGILDMLAFVQRLLSARQPVLGVCFGHQLLGRALGGDVRRSPAGWEVGSPTVELTPAGLESPLFAGFNSHFAAIQSHRDAVLALPSPSRILATSARSPIQAFSFEDRVFGVQFHPEMDGEILRQLWTDRREKLRGETDFDLDQALDSAAADDEVARVFQNFAGMLA